MDKIRSEGIHLKHVQMYDLCVLISGMCCRLYPAVHCLCVGCGAGEIHLSEIQDT